MKKMSEPPRRGQATVRLRRAKPIPGLENRETWGTRKTPGVGKGMASSVPLKRSLDSGPARVPAPLPKVGSLLFSTGTPLPPFVLQNLEKTRVILPLCARSLSLKELHAKSREHWSYGGRDVPFWNSARHLERGLEAAPSPGSDCQRSTIIL